MTGDKNGSVTNGSGIGISSAGSYVAVAHIARQSIPLFCTVHYSSRTLSVSKIGIRGATPPPAA